MKKISSCWRVVVVLSLALLACSKSHKSTGPDATPRPLFHLCASQMRVSAVIPSTDTVAMDAKHSISVALAAVSSATALGLRPSSHPDSLLWEPATQGCWTTTYHADECTGTYHVCQPDSMCQWSLTLNGSCSGLAVHDLLFMEATTKVPATGGIIHWYVANSPDTELVYEWHQSEECTSCLWQSYSIPPSSVYSSNLYSWTRNEDLTEVVEWATGNYKFRVLPSVDGHSGRYEAYIWDGSSHAYRLIREIIWNADGSGSRTVYHADGSVADRATWN